MKRLLATAFLLCSVPATLLAQTTAPLNAPHAKDVGFPFKNMQLLKPPTGAKVAVYEFEDMECPHCAADYATVRSTVAARKLPYIRRDFPLTEIHLWSFDAAVTARYIQNNLSPALAEQFRRDVFANQARILNKDDLARYTRQWFDSHKQNLPFVLDAKGDCRAQVRSDRAFGENLGIRGTPCLFVVTQKRWVLVMDVAQLNHTIDAALAETASPALIPRRSAKPQHAPTNQPG
jgi:protein-disulfide isomerase